MKEPSDQLTAEPAADVAADPVVEQRPKRVVLRRVVTVLAGLLLFCALTLPREIDQVTPSAFLRIPVEGLAAVALLLLLPARAPSGRRGGWRGAARPPHDHQVHRHGLPGDGRAPVRPGARLVARRRRLQLRARVVRRGGGRGRVGARGRARRRRDGRHDARGAAPHRTPDGRRRPATKAVAVLSVVWVGAAVLGTTLVDPVPLASRSVAALVYQDATQIPISLHDRAEFDGGGRRRRVPRHPDDQLLTGLRGKDVCSRSSRATAAARSRTRRSRRWSTRVLDAGTAAAAGGRIRRAQRLPHLADVRRRQLARARHVAVRPVDRQPAALPQPGRQRPPDPDQRVPAGRLARRSASMPARHRAWPEGDVLRLRPGLRRPATSGYHGPNFGWSPMPDQYTLAAFQRRERGKPGRAPLMAEIVLISSHAPWTPLPQLIDWNARRRRLGLRRAWPTSADRADVVWQDTDRVRAGYRESIEYSLEQPRLLRARRTATTTSCWSSSATTSPPDRHRRRRQPGRADHDRRPRPGGARPDLGLGLARRPAPGPAGPGVADGRLPRPVPDRLRAARRSQPLSSQSVDGQSVDVSARKAARSSAGTALVSSGTRP